MIGKVDAASVKEEEEEEEEKNKKKKKKIRITDETDVGEINFGPVGPRCRTFGQPLSRIKLTR